MARTATQPAIPIDYRSRPLPAYRSKPKIPWKQHLGTAVRYAALIALSALFVMPFLWMLGTSLTSADEVLNLDLPLFPSNFFWSNYRHALIDVGLPFSIFLKNTLLISLLATFGQTFSAACVAFAFARLKFPYRDGLFLLVLSTMMLPAQVTMIPQFMMFAKLGWVDTLKPLIVPAFFGGGAFFIFLLRQFFLTVPRELEEAARLDGCSTFGVFWYIMLPMSKPALTTVALFAFIAHWNDFFGPLIYLSTKPELQTLAIGLQRFNGIHYRDPGLIQAGTLMTLIIPVVAFLLTQRFFTRGLVVTGVEK